MLMRRNSYFSGFDTMLDCLFNNNFKFYDLHSGPLFTTYKDSDDLILESEVPGLNKDDLEVKVEDRVLTIVGETKDKEAHKQYSFTKKYTLPYDVDLDVMSPEAELRDGILSVRFKGYYKEIGPPKTKALKVPVK